MQLRAFRSGLKLPIKMFERDRMAPSIVRNGVGHARFSSRTARLWSVAMHCGVSIVCLVLGACASRLAPVDGSSELERFTARAAIRYGEEGGSGKLHATRLSDGFRYEFYGALGQGHWRLTQTSMGAEFAAADGTIERADTAELLMLRRLGWQVPIAALWSWSSGQALPNEAAFETTFDDSGRLQSLQQLGFDIEYRDWSQDTAGRWRPSRVTISRNDLRIRMKIASWTG